MTQSEHQAREQRAKALIPLVKKVEGGYRVGSTRDPNTWYFVSKVDGRIYCSCPDFEKHAEEDPRWECKHICAVRLAHKLGKLNGNGTNKAQADLEASALFGDPEAARQLDAQDQAQEGEAQTATATAEAPEEEAAGSAFELIEIEEEAPGSGPGQSLEPCAICRTRISTHELIPVQFPHGTTLVCQTCYDGCKALDQVQGRLCGSCGARLPIEELTLFEAEFGLVTLCQRCSVKREWDEKEKAKSPVSTTPPLADGIARANEVLASFGSAAIEKVAVKNRQGQVVKDLFGYGLQYTLDAVNTALGPDAWRYKLLEWRAIEEGKGALVLIDLELWDGASWHSHGPMFGTTALSDEGDGLKGAIGDAIKKSFAYWGIGNLAYRGELEQRR